MQWRAGILPNSQFHPAIAGTNSIAVLNSNTSSVYLLSRTATERTPLPSDGGRGWRTESMMDNSLRRVLLSATDVRESSSMPTTESALLTSLSGLTASLLLMLHPQYTTPHLTTPHHGAPLTAPRHSLQTHGDPNYTTLTNRKKTKEVC